jgi:hypothetical protein
MADEVVRVQVGSPGVGLWCSRCALPSVLRFPLVVLSDDGVSPAGWVDYCAEHQTVKDAVEGYRG